jgi:hypothetical protein
MTFAGNLLVRNRQTNLFSSAVAAYSLRNLNLSLSNVVKVRRSNDNVESDFTANEITNGTLAAWVGAGNNGHVVTWYDQTGNGQNLTQSVAANQPIIVSNGSVVQGNSKPSIDFSSTSHLLATNLTGLTTYTALDYWCYCIPVLAAAANTSTISIGRLSVEGNNNREYYFGCVATGNLSNETLSNYVSTNTIGRLGANSTYYTRTANFPSLFNIQAYTTGFKEFVNGQEITLNLNAGVNVNQDLTPAIVCDTNLFELVGEQGAHKTSEVIVFDTQQASNRSSIEASINNYYNIY